MAANANQTSANNPKDLYLSTDGGSRMKYNSDIQFATTANGTSPFESTARILTTSGLLCIQNDSSINFTMPGQGLDPKVQINPDAAQSANGFPGLYVSSTAVVGDTIVGSGFGTGGTTLELQHRDTAGNGINTLNWYFQRNQSTMGLLSYQSKDAFSFNPITTPIMTFNPYNNNSLTPLIDIPTYTLQTSNIVVSSINGTSIPTTNAIIDIPQIIPANAAYPQAVTSAASVSNSGIVAGGIYQYDLTVSLLSAVANNVGAAPTYPYNILFGVRLGGNGAFNYTHTVALQSAGGLGAGGIAFNLVGTATAGNSAQTIEIVIFQGQTGTTVTLSFAAPIDPTMTLQRIQ